MSEEVRDAVGKVSTAIDTLRVSIADLSAQVGKLSTSAAVRARLHASLAYEKDQKQQGVLMWTVTAESGPVRAITVGVALDGRVAGPATVHDLGPGQSFSGIAASPGQLKDSGQVGLTVKYEGIPGQQEVSTSFFSYYKEKNWVGWLKNVRVSPA
ncbi:MAG TPA: hypothetical protein VMH38_03440 [Thermoplasmata archaeon]|nr:hypothetical protein [Thermoplasmata archaeon]